MSNEQYLPRLLVKILRHDSSLKRDVEGYVEATNLVKGVSIQKIKEIVEKDNKGRLSLIYKEGKYYIRANQGHSKEVGKQLDDTKTMKRITEPIEGVFHGSYIQHKDSIMKNGLNRMSRKHIHIAKSMDAKSGKRENCTLLVYIDMKQAMEDGIIFYESENGVILTEGIDGVILPKYLMCV